MCLGHSQKGAHVFKITHPIAFQFVLVWGTHHTGGLTVDAYIYICVYVFVVFVLYACCFCTAAIWWTGISADGHLVDGHLVDGHLVDGHICWRLFWTAFWWMAIWWTKPGHLLSRMPGNASNQPSDRSPIHPPTPWVNTRVRKMSKELIESHHGKQFWKLESTRCRFLNPTSCLELVGTSENTTIENTFATVKKQPQTENYLLGEKQCTRHHLRT